MRRQSLLGRVVFVASGVAALVGVLFAVALVAILSLRHAESRESRSKDVAVQTLRVRALYADLESSLRGYVLSESPRFLTSFHATQKKVPPALDKLRALVANDAQQRARVDQVRADINDYVQLYAENVIRIAEISSAAARGPAAGEEAKHWTQQIDGTLDNLLKTEDSRVRDLSSHARTIANVALVIGVAALVISTALVLLFGAWVARGVAGPVRRLAGAATDVARGDLEVRLEEGGTGEVGALVSAFNSMTRSLETSRRELVTQNERLRESERHQRDLIGMVSHELRTPLAAVLGFTALLLQREFASDERRRYLEIIDTQARRLARLAGDFLDVQLLEGGGLTLVREEFDLVELVREQARLFFLDPGDHKPVLDLPEEPVTLNADRDRLAQVVGNLLSNAVKYSPEGGEVRVTVRNGGSEAVVEVTDEGVGIADEDAERIFEKFFRTDDASTSVGGTGLGLAVAREIVQTHGGTIGVESEPGHGATFTVRLPTAAQGNSLRRVV
jgi:signal transduction histidine kinase